MRTHTVRVYSIKINFGQLLIGMAYCSRNQQYTHTCRMYALCCAHCIRIKHTVAKLMATVTDREMATLNLLCTSNRNKSNTIRNDLRVGSILLCIWIIAAQFSVCKWKTANEAQEKSIKLELDANRIFNKIGFMITFCVSFYIYFQCVFVHNPPHKLI